MPCALSAWGAFRQDIVMVEHFTNVILRSDIDFFIRLLPNRIPNHQSSVRFKMLPNMSPPVAKLSTFFLLLLLFTSCHTVQLSELIRNKDKFISPVTIQSTSDTTALISATPNYISYRALRLHPIVSIPEPRGTRTTLLLAHVHVSNKTVIWAHAVTTFGLTDYGVSVDEEGNIFVTGISAGISGAREGRERSIVILKLSSSGAVLWKTFHTPPLFDHIHSLYTTPSGIGRSVIVFTSRSELIMIGTKETNSGDRVAYLVFSATNGNFLRLVEPFQPRETRDLQEPTNAVVTSTSKGPLACSGFTASKNSNRIPESLYARCTLLGSKRKSFLRKLETLNSTNDFSHVNNAGIQTSAPRSLFIASEKVRKLERRVTSHDLFVRRISTKTLNEVNWTSGKEKSPVNPVIISFPNRNKTNFGNSHATFHLDLQYSTKTETVAFLFWSAIIMNEVNNMPAKNGRIFLNGRQKTRREEVQYWLFFIDKKQRLTSRLLPIDKDVPEEERKYFDVGQISFSLDESLVYIAGSVKSKLFIRCVVNPFFSGKGKKPTC